MSLRRVSLYQEILDMKEKTSRTSRIQDRVIIGMNLVGRQTHVMIIRLQNDLNGLEACVCVPNSKHSCLNSSIPYGMLFRRSISQKFRICHKVTPLKELVLSKLRTRDQNYYSLPLIFPSFHPSHFFSFKDTDS